MITKKKKKKETRGGARPGTGPKKSEDPNVPITIQVRESKVNALGGKESVKELCLFAVNNS